MDKSKIAEGRLVPADGGSRVCFICGVTGANFLTEQVYCSTAPEQVLPEAWEKEGRSHFNQCRRCGKWVFDVAFNPEVLECIECAPFECEASFCKFCGVRVPKRSRTCPSCGKPLYYEGVDAYDAEAQA